MTDLTPPRPRGTSHFWRLAAPFILVALACEASAVLPPGPADVGAFWTSLVLLVATAASLALARAAQGSGLVLIPITLYLTSVTFLFLAGGTNPAVPSTTSGLTPLVLLPVLAIALFYDRSYAPFVVFASLVPLLVIGVASHATVASLVRREVTWGAIGILVTVSIIGLRQRLHERVVTADRLARLNALLTEATQRLTSLDDPDTILEEGAHWFSLLASSDLLTPTEAEFVVAQRGEAPSPSRARAHDDTAGPFLWVPEWRAQPGDEPETVWFPIASGDVQGAFVVTVADQNEAQEVLQRCQALAGVLELALGRASAHRELETFANSDPLTGLANRRRLTAFLDEKRRNRERTILMMDLDGLKDINDRLGHEVGDAVLVGVANAISHTLREEDLLARVGGDEFVAVLEGIRPDDAAVISERIGDTVSSLEIAGIRPRLSIGASGMEPGEDLDEVLRRADQQMYQRKGVRAKPRVPTAADAPRIELVQ